MKTIYVILLFLISFSTVSFAQVPDSIVLKVHRSSGGSNPMSLGNLEVDTFSAGLKIGGTIMGWINNNWQLNNRKHYDYNLQNRLSVVSTYSLSQNLWVPSSIVTYTYDINDNVIMINNDNGNSVGRTVYNYNGQLLGDIFYEIFTNGIWVRNFWTHYEYDANGNRILSVDYRLKNTFWIPTNFVESEYGFNGQWNTDTTYSITTKKNYSDYQIHMRDSLGRDTAIYKHIYIAINPDPWILGYRYVNIYDWKGRLLIENGRTDISDFSTNYESGTTYHYDSIQHYTNFSDLTPGLCHSGGSISYQSDDSTPIVESGYNVCPDGSSDGYTNYYYFTANSSDVFLPPSISKCSNDTLHMPVIYNPFKSYSNYLWTPSAGLSSDTVAVPVINVNNSTTYTLFLTDGNGIVDTAEILILVSQTNFDSIVVGYIDTTSICQLVTLIVSPSDQSYQWELNDSIISTAEQITLKTNGTYFLTTTNLNGCVYRDSISINYLTPYPRPIVSASCSGVLNVILPGATAYYWYGYTNSDIDFTSPDYLGSTTRDSLVLTQLQLQNYCYYFVQCVDSVGCSRLSNLIRFRPDRLPVSYVPESCSGLCDVILTINYSSYNSYYINFPYTISFATGDSLIITGPGYYYVDSICSGSLQYTLINGNGCVITNSIQINPPNPATYTMVSGSDVSSIDSCNGEIQITPVNFTPGNYSYACLDDTNCTYFVADSGYTFTNLCFGDHTVQTYSGTCADRFDVLIDTLQCVVVNNSVSTSCIGCSNGVIYFHANGQAPFFVSIDPVAGIINTDSITGLSPGIYIVCVTDSSGCSRCFTDTIFEDPTGITSTDLRNILIYPNPTKGKFSLSFSSTQSESIFTMNVISSEGEIQISEPIKSGIKYFDFSRLSNGIYFLQIEGKNEIWRRKLVIVK